jgi:hypothetical protein
MDGCGSQAGGVALDGVDVAKEAVIQGVVSRDGAPVAGAYVRLLDSGGDFTAELPTSDDGSFRFFARPGRWTVRVLAPGSSIDRAVVANRGQITEVALAI